MPLFRLGTSYVAFALMLLPGGCASATITDDLAARAVAEAKSMPAGRARDITLREVSRNLRYADCDHAVEAAAAMSEDYEPRTFDSAPDRLTIQILARQHEQNSDALACKNFIERLKPASVTAEDEQHIRNCFFMDAPPGIVPPATPPFRLILMAADALPPGSTKAELLYRATWEGVPDRPAGGAAEAVRRLRALIPTLDRDTRQEATGWLDTIAVDLIEGRPDAAIARVERDLARTQSTPASLSEDSPVKAQGLIGDFLRAHDIDRAVAVTNLLAPSADCAMLGDGLTGVAEFVLPMQDSDVVAAYMARLQASRSLARLCPNGLGDEIAAKVWLTAGDDDRALDAVTRSGKPLIITATRLAIIERRTASGDIRRARSMAQATATALPPLDAGDEFERVAAANQRIRLIHLLAETGDLQQAKRLASGYPGPGWRGFAYSVIVATINRSRAGANWAGPFLDLHEVAADR